MQEKIKGILFDVDGVLVDSEEPMARALIQYFGSLGAELNPQDLVQFIGVGEDTCIHDISQKFGLTLDIPTTKREVTSLYGKIVENQMGPMNGVKNFISNAKKAGLKLALASSADITKVGINIKCAGFKLEDFDFVACGSNVQRKKPFGDIYKFASFGLGLIPSQCLVVEDATNGHRAARDAGCPSLGILGSFTEDQLMASGADAVVKDLSSFEDFDDLASFNTALEKLFINQRQKSPLKELIETAIETRKKAYAPYSRFLVGAALLTENGNIYGGCNVENASFGGTICAERGAAMKAIAAEGRVRFTALAVATDVEVPAPPCAICRQFLSEFADLDMQVYLYSVSNGEVLHMSFSSLLPYGFEL